MLFRVADCTYRFKGMCLLHQNVVLWSTKCFWLTKIVSSKAYFGPLNLLQGTFPLSITMILFCTHTIFSIVKLLPNFFEGQIFYIYLFSPNFEDDDCICVKSDWWTSTVLKENWTFMNLLLTTCLELLLTLHFSYYPRMARLERKSVFSSVKAQEEA